MNAKHQFKYTYNDTNLEEFSPVEITFDMPGGEATINQMLYNFESYLKACGYYFDGHLEVVAEESYEELNASDELDGTLYEFKDKADFDKACGCETTSSPLENDDEDDDDDGPTFHDTLSTAICENSKWSKAEKMVKDFKEGIAKLDNEQLQKAMKTAHEMSGLHYEATKEVVKNNWVHGMCNPPADDAKEYVKDCKSTDKKYNSVDAMLKGLMKKRSRDSQLY